MSITSVTRTSDTVYSRWLGGPATYVRQVRRGMKGASRGSWLVIPPEKLPAHELELQRAGYNCLGQLLDVSGLDQQDRLWLANNLDRTRKEQEEYAGEGLIDPNYLEHEARLLGRCPRLTVTGYELDLTRDLKGSQAGREALLRAGQAIRDHYAKRGVRLRWSWSASCPHGVECPHRGPCPEGVSGLHGEPGIATAEGAHPELLNLFLYEVRRVAKELGIPTEETEGYSGAWLDVSTLRPRGETRGSVFRPLGAAHSDRGPKIPCRELGWDPKPTQLSQAWLWRSFRELDLAHAEEVVVRRQLEELPPREREPGPLAELERGGASFPRTVRLLNEIRPASGRDRQAMTLTLATVLLEAGLTRQQATDVLQSGFQRQDRRTVEHAVESTQLMLARCQQDKEARRPAGKGRLIRDGHYTDLCRLSATLAQDAREAGRGASLFQIYMAIARLWQSAGRSMEQLRAEELLVKYGPGHRYAKALKNSLACGTKIMKECSGHGPQGMRIFACKCHWDPRCKGLQIARQAACAAELWAGESEIYAVVSREFSSLRELHRYRAQNDPGGKHNKSRSRWFVGCRGPGRFYCVVLLPGKHAETWAYYVSSRSFGESRKVTVAEAAELAHEALLSTHGACRDLFMKHEQAWLDLMDQIHKRKLTNGKPGCLPWPSRPTKEDEVVVAQEHDHEPEDDCGLACQQLKLVSWSAIDPVSGREIGVWHGFPPSVNALVRRMETSGILLPSRRLQRVARSCGPRAPT